MKYILARLLIGMVVPSLATRLPSEKVRVKPLAAKLTLLPSVLSSVRNLKSVALADNRRQVKTSDKKALFIVEFV